jgi:hypothetical protein
VLEPVLEWAVEMRGGVLTCPRFCCGIWMRQGAWPLPASAWWRVQGPVRTLDLVRGVAWTRRGRERELASPSLLPCIP